MKIRNVSNQQNEEAIEGRVLKESIKGKLGNTGEAKNFWKKSGITIPGKIEDETKKI